MFQKQNDRLAELKSAQRQRETWLLRENLLKDELARLMTEKDNRMEQFKSEQRDVDRLTGLSLGSLFYALIGKKQEKLSQEETELLQAKLRLEEAQDSVADLEQELAEVKGSLLETRFLQQDIDTLLREKERSIRNLRPDLAIQLEQLTEQAAEAKADCKELKEAVDAGRSVLSCLDRAREMLDSAKNWGTYDMLGGGIIATHIKHNRIDEARNAIHSASYKLQRFQRELQDVERDVNVKIDIGGMLAFGDYFFDGLFMDWIVQGRIKEAVAQVEEKYSRVSKIVSDLSFELRRKESELTAYTSRQSQLIETA